MKKIFCVLLCAVCAASCLLAGCEKQDDPIPQPQPAEIADTDILLAENGATGYQIVIPENADACEEYAAQELELLFEEATGADIAVVRDTGMTFDESEKVISLGETSIKQGSGLDVAAAGLNADGAHNHIQDTCIPTFLHLVLYAFSDVASLLPISITKSFSLSFTSFSSEFIFLVRWLTIDMLRPERYP